MDGDMAPTRAICDLAARSQRDAIYGLFADLDPPQIFVPKSDGILANERRTVRRTAQRLPHFRSVKRDNLSDASTRPHRWGCHSAILDVVSRRMTMSRGQLISDISDAHCQNCQTKNEIIGGKGAKKPSDLG